MYPLLHLNRFAGTSVTRGPQVEGSDTMMIPNHPFLYDIRYMWHTKAPEISWLFNSDFYDAINTFGPNHWCGAPNSQSLCT